MAEQVRNPGPADPPPRLVICRVREFIGCPCSSRLRWRISCALSGQIPYDAVNRSSVRAASWTGARMPNGADRIAEIGPNSSGLALAAVK